jgi:hypothetical protein
MLGRAANGEKMKAFKIIAAILCFGLGAAFAIGAISALRDPTSESVYAYLPGMFSAMFLLGTYLLLRQ